MRATDQMLARLAAEIEEKAQVHRRCHRGRREGRPRPDRAGAGAGHPVPGPAGGAQRPDGAAEGGHPDRGESARQDRARSASFMAQTEGKPKREMEYRSAGAYVLDMWQAGLGNATPSNGSTCTTAPPTTRLTTDTDRCAAGAGHRAGRQLRRRRPPAGLRARPAAVAVRDLVTAAGHPAHQRRAQQSAEKTELTSQKMIIEKSPVTASTYGGYVNVSQAAHRLDCPADHGHRDPGPRRPVRAPDRRRNRRPRSSPPPPPARPGWAPPRPRKRSPPRSGAAAGASTPPPKAQAGCSRGVAPHMLGLLGPLFAPVNPQNAQSPGFTAVNYGTGRRRLHLADPRSTSPPRSPPATGPDPVHRRRGGVRRPGRRRCRSSSLPCSASRSPTPATSRRW